MPIDRNLTRDRNRLGLLAAGMGMMGAPSLDVGMQRGLAGLLAALQQADETDRADAALQMAQERQRMQAEQQPYELQRLQAEAERYRALAQNGGQDSYFQPLQTSDGYMVFNARTGGYEPMTREGRVVMPPGADPSLQAQLQAAKEGQKTLKGPLASDPTGPEYYKPAWQADPAFKDYRGILPALIQQESGGNVNAVSSKGARGLMQAMPDTAKQPGYGVEPMRDNSADEQIRFGSDYLRALLRENGGDVAKALSAYNQGQGGLERNGISNRGYVDAVMNRAGLLAGPSLQDKANIEVATKQAQDANKADIENQQKIGQIKDQRAYDASSVMDLVSQIEPLIDKATGSGFGAMYDSASALFGNSPDGAAEAAQLKALGGVLVSKMPKMTGPQSDKDVQLYKEMAGNIGDPATPREQKKAALKTIKSLNEKYLSGSTDNANQTAGGSIQDRINEYKRRAGLK